LNFEERRNTNQVDNIEVFRRVIEEGYNKGNLAALDEQFAPGFTEHQEGFAPPNLQGVKANIAVLRAAFPDFKMTFEDWIAGHDKTWAHMTARGTHLGQFVGLSPTGKRFAITVIDICRFENGRIAEHWGVADRLSLMGQIRDLARPSS
jgi:predicted ester cyclase